MLPRTPQASDFTLPLSHIYEIRLVGICKMASTETPINYWQLHMALPSEGQLGPEVLTNAII
jgi:hypothetical protein